MADRALERASLLYLALPWLVFAVGWLRMPWAACVVGMLVVVALLEPRRPEIDWEP